MSVFTVLLIALAAPATSLPTWEFTSDIQGWTPNEHLKNVVVQKSLLCVDAVDWDPMLIRSGFEFEASPSQYIEVQMKATSDGKGELFWTGKLEGPNGGFAAEKSTPFGVIGNGKIQTIRIYPFWQAEHTIRGLRLDLYDKTHFEIASIKIKAWEGEQAKTLDGPMHAWYTSDDGRTFWSPPLAIPVEQAGWVAVTMRTKSTYADLLWATEDKFGARSLRFETEANNQSITYNVELGGQPEWRNKLVAVGVQVPESGATIESVVLTEKPLGNARLLINYFGAEDAANRVGVPRTILARITNFGGKDSVALPLPLKLGPDMHVVAEPNATGIPVLESVKPGQTGIVRWSVICEKAGDHEIAITLPEGKVHTATITSTEAVAAVAGDYVPKPQPVTTDIDVCAYYFPGWETNAKWECIRKVAPNRKPALGYYDESNPECVDWQIKWAVENGISCFLVDWYWSAGQESLTHWFEAYRKARYRDMLKVAIMWANHNAPNTHSQEDWTAVTREWIDHYFNLPAYYRADEKPVIMIWAPDNVRNDLKGSAGVKQALENAQTMARKAGYPGIKFVAMGEHFSASGVKELLDEGYSAISTYHEWGRAAQPAMATTNRMPYARLVESAPEAWNEKNTQSGALAYWPVIDSGWDTRPWHGDKAFLIEGRTTPLFEQLLQKGKTFALENKKNCVVLGPLNEWGEGSYLEPCTEFGFGMYEAVRRTFATPGKASFPQNLFPSDIQRGPFDYPPIEAVSEWSAAKGNLTGRGVGWKPFMNITKFETTEGKLVFTTGSDDSALFVATQGLEAAMFKSVSITMTLTGPLPANSNGQLFWGSDRDTLGEATSYSFPLQTDGLEHTYTLPLVDKARWRGTVTTLRFDPCETRGMSVMISSIAFHK